MQEYLRNALLTMKLNDWTVDEALNDLYGFECSICDFGDADCQRDLNLGELEILQEYGVEIAWDEFD